jgi:hypothetical protein
MYLINNDKSGEIAGAPQLGSWRTEEELSGFFHIINRTQCNY